MTKNIVGIKLKIHPFLLVKFKDLERKQQNLSFFVNRLKLSCFLRNSKNCNEIKNQDNHFSKRNRM